MEHNIIVGTDRFESEIVQSLMLPTYSYSWRNDIKYIKYNSCTRTYQIIQHVDQRQHWENSRSKYLSGPNSYCTKYYTVFILPLLEYYNFIFEMSYKSSTKCLAFHKTKINNPIWHLSSDIHIYYIGIPTHESKSELLYIFIRLSYSQR